MRYALDARHRAVPYHCLTAVCLSVAMTAYYAMFEEARLRPGHNVLVHSAAGGVGTMLCQMGKIIGCKVVGVVGRGHKVKYALAHGCDHVIDKSTQDLWALASEFAPEGYHAVFGTWRATWCDEAPWLTSSCADANGVSTLKQSFAHLAPTGRLVVYGFHSMLPRRGMFAERRICGGSVVLTRLGAQAACLA